MATSPASNQQNVVSETPTNNKKQTTDNKQQTTNSQQTTNNKQETTNNRQQTTNNKQQQATNNKQQATNNKQCPDQRRPAASKPAATLIDETMPGSDTARGLQASGHSD
jgi:hypothetical protein